MGFTGLRGLSGFWGVSLYFWVVLTLLLFIKHKASLGKTTSQWATMLGKVLKDQPIVVFGFRPVQAESHFSSASFLGKISLWPNGRLVFAKQNISCETWEPPTVCSGVMWWVWSRRTPTGEAVGLALSQWFLECSLVVFLTFSPFGLKGIYN